MYMYLPGRVNLFTNYSHKWVTSYCTYNEGTCTISVMLATLLPWLCLLVKKREKAIFIFFYRKHLGQICFVNVHHVRA